jgi:hypothetical protein
MELIKTPIKQNRALIGLRTSVTPMAKPRASAATPTYRIKSHKLQNNEARLRIAVPLRAKEALNAYKIIKGRISQLNGLYLATIELKSGARGDRTPASGL